MSTLEAYLDGIIDYREYINRRYAEETDELTSALGRVSRLSGDGDSRRTDADRGDVKEPSNER